MRKDFSGLADQASELIILRLELETYINDQEVCEPIQIPQQYVIFINFKCNFKGNHEKIHHY